jgi:hypothetical protein
MRAKYRRMRRAALADAQVQLNGIQRLLDGVLALDEAEPGDAHTFQEHSDLVKDLRHTGERYAKALRTLRGRLR